jgi:hypothetical protein
VGDFLWARYSCEVNASPRPGKSSSLADARAKSPLGGKSIPPGKALPEAGPATRKRHTRSYLKYLSITFRKSTPPQNRQLIVLISNSRQ